MAGAALVLWSLAAHAQTAPALPPPAAAEAASRPTIESRAAPTPQHLSRFAPSRFATPASPPKPDTKVVPGGTAQTAPVPDPKSALTDSLKQAMGLANAVGITLPPTKGTPEQRGKRVTLPDHAHPRDLPKLSMRQAGAQGFEPAQPVMKLPEPAQP